MYKYSNNFVLKQVKNVRGKTNKKKSRLRKKTNETNKKQRVWQKVLLLFFSRSEVFWEDVYIPALQDNVKL